MGICVRACAFQWILLMAIFRFPHHQSPENRPDRSEAKWRDRRLWNWPEMLASRFTRPTRIRLCPKFNRISSVNRFASIWNLGEPFRVMTPTRMCTLCDVILVCHVFVVGRAGTDYPILAAVPYTNFYCDEQKYPGFFADVDTRCQGRQSFRSPSHSCSVSSGSMVLRRYSLALLRHWRSSGNVFMPERDTILASRVCLWLVVQRALRFIHEIVRNQCTAVSAAQGESGEAAPGHFERIDWEYFQLNAVAPLSWPYLA